MEMSFFNMSRHSPVTWLRFVPSNYISFNLKKRLATLALKLDIKLSFTDVFAVKLLPKEVTVEATFNFQPNLSSDAVIPTATNFSENAHSSAFPSAPMISSSRNGSAGPPQSFMCTNGRCYIK